jgi:hypothetical protein
VTEPARYVPLTGSDVHRVSEPRSPYLFDRGLLARLGEIFVVVIDTSVITKDIIRTFRGGLPSPLFLALRTGLIRGFMAHHTWAEVPRVLAKRASAENLDSAELEKLWWRSYIGVIRFVPTGDLPFGDPVLMRELAERDASDLPTLKLASLLAPVVVLAADRDLKDIGLAYERWQEVPEAVRRIVAGQGGTEFAARALFGAGYGAVVAVRGAARALQRPPVALTVLGILGVAYLTRRWWYPPLKQRIDGASPAVREAGGKIGRAVYGMFEQYFAALTVWSSAQCGRQGRTLTHRVARILATSRTPMTRTEMTKLLRDEVSRHGRRSVMTELGTILSRHQAFCEITRGRWQLGKENASFGGRALPPASLRKEGAGPVPMAGPSVSREAGAAGQRGH